jgi:aspartyl-tRNA(Asn)/glutamyl-tRNA(Gln) amidotransferase subunit C
MSLSLEQVQRIAALARIAVSPEEARGVMEQLNRVLALIDQMQAQDTRGIEPMAHALDAREAVFDLREFKDLKASWFGGIQWSLNPSLSFGLVYRNGAPRPPFSRIHDGLWCRMRPCESVSYTLSLRMTYCRLSCRLLPYGSTSTIRPSSPTLSRNACRLARKGEVINLPSPRSSVSVVLKGLGRRSPSRITSALDPN